MTPRTLAIRTPDGTTRIVPIAAPFERIRDRYRAALLQGEVLYTTPDGWRITHHHRDGTTTTTTYTITEGNTP